MGYNRLQWVTVGYNGIIIVGYNGLQWITLGYKVGYNGLQ